MIYVDLFLAFARVGLLGFGGGPSMIPLLQKECVSAGWTTEEQFLEALAAGNALPGPITTKMAVYVGLQEAGVGGAVAATLGMVLPSALLMGVLAAVVIRYREHRFVAAALEGVKPAIVGMLAFVAYDLAPAGVKSPATAVVALVAFLALVYKVHPGMVIVGAVLVGWVGFRG